MMNPLNDPNFARDLAFGAPAPSMAAPAMSGAGGGMAAPSGITVPSNVLQGAYSSVQPAGGFLKGLGGLEGLSSILQGIGSLGQVYASIKGLGIAKDQLNFSKEAYQTNLKNTTQNYNTTLEDRIRSRYHTEGRETGEAEKYLSKHAL
jgi:hypothetical protein